MPHQDQLTEFYLWFKEKTEAYWTTCGIESMQEFIRRDDLMQSWQKDTRWNGGFSEVKIAAAEAEYGIQFPADYRLFLQMLGAPDRPMYFRNWDGETFEGTWFTNLQHPEAIWQTLQGMQNGICFDVEHNRLWLQSWGPRPDTPEERQDRIATLLQDAPKVFPVYGHRFLVLNPGLTTTPILSIMQTDIIVYGLSFPSWLQKECQEELQDQRFWWAPEDQDEVYRQLASLPFWGEWIG